VVELARRKTADPKRIRAVRGFQRKDLRKHISQMAGCIRHALDLPREECPRPPRRENGPQLNVVGQLLATAVANRCRALKIAPALAGSVQDVRDLIAYRLGIQSDDQQRPLLAAGWRAEVIGPLVDDLLSGRLVVRITDPLSEDPLSFEPAGGDLQRDAAAD
jgi:ribonuclease D